MYNVHIRGVKFDWDDKKNRTNSRKHSVTFEEAESVFLDDDAIRFEDPDHSTEEDRFIMLGLSHRSSVLVVCHCLREDNSIIRIISARKATKKEQRTYWSWW